MQSQPYNTDTKMASPPQQEEHKKAMAMAMTTPQLLTPDQPLVHSFVASAPAPQMPASPPASPEFNPSSTSTSFQQSQPMDDVLFPDHNNTEAEDNPLFETSNQWTQSAQEPASPSASSLSVSTPRTQPDSPRTQVDDSPRKQPVGPVQLYNTYGMEYYRYLVTQAEDFRARQREQRRLPPARPTRGAGRDRYTQDLVFSLGKMRVEKSKPAAKPAPVVTRAKTPKPVKAAANVKSDSPPKRNRRKTATPDPSTGAITHGVQPKPRTRAPPTKKLGDVGDDQWQELPDYTPPLETLDHMDRKLAVNWTTHPLSLDHDPYVHHLHPQEVEIASILRLKGEQYLGSKRRIFRAKLEHIKEGKEFNKTAAQNCCQIDVNKASRLWAAFDGVGWLDRSNFEQWL